MYHCKSPPWRLAHIEAADVNRPLLRQIFAHQHGWLCSSLRQWHGGHGWRLTRKPIICSFRAPWRVRSSSKHPAGGRFVRRAQSRRGRCGTSLQSKINRDCKSSIISRVDVPWYGRESLENTKSNRIYWTRTLKASCLPSRNALEDMQWHALMHEVLSLLVVVWNASQIFFITISSSAGIRQ